MRTQPEQSGLTKFLCDCIRKAQGQMTIGELRKRYGSGEYPGVKSEWAKYYVEAING